MLDLEIETEQTMPLCCYSRLLDTRFRGARELVIWSPTARLFWGLPPGLYHFVHFSSLWICLHTFMFMSDPIYIYRYIYIIYSLGSFCNIPRLHVEEKSQEEVEKSHRRTLFDFWVCAKSIKKRMLCFQVRQGSAGEALRKTMGNLFPEPEIWTRATMNEIEIEIDIQIEIEIDIEIEVEIDIGKGIGIWNEIEMYV